MQRGYWLSFAALGCGPGQAAALLAAPPEINGHSEAPLELRFYAVDASGDQVAKTVDAQVADPAVADWDGHQLQCRNSGQTSLTARLGELHLDVPVRCDLVKEVRLPELLLVEPGPLRVLQPDLIGQDEQLIEHPWSSSSSNPEVVQGLEAVGPGEAVVTVTAGFSSATVRVLVGRYVVDESVELDLEEGWVYPLPTGHHVVRTVSEDPAGVAFMSGPPSCRGNGLRVELECALHQPGDLRVQNLGSKGSWSGTVQVFSLP